MHGKAALQDHVLGKHVGQGYSGRRETWKSQKSDDNVSKTHGFDVITGAEG
jgi:hypothetical protein